MTISAAACAFIFLAGLGVFAQPLAARASTSPTDSFNDLQLLGKNIFEDKSLSDPAGTSCASCHDPAKAFQGNNGSRVPALARGSRAEHFGTRNTPTLAYSVFTPPFHFESEKGDDGKIETKATGGQFLDGRAMDLAHQAEGPMLHPNEMNNASKDVVVEKIAKAPYAPMVKKIFGEDVFKNKNQAYEKLASAIAAFESTKTFIPFSSKFDAVLQGKNRFTALEAKGFELFKSPTKGNCMACHVGNEKSKNPTDWMFTDYTYDNLGIPRNNDIPENKVASYFDLGLCKRTSIEKIAPKDVDIESLCGAFKVPTLRNIAKTAPYGHNGFFRSLRDVVKFYVTRDTNPKLWYPKNADGTINKFNDLPKNYRVNVNTSEVPYDRKPGEKPRLDDSEIDAIVAFLKTLTDDQLHSTSD